MSIDLSVPAGQVLSADLTTPPPAATWAGAGRFVGALVRVATDTATPEDAAARRDVLITRKDTGAAVLQADADSNADADAVLLDHVRSQLDGLTLGQFLEKWGIAATSLD